MVHIALICTTHGHPWYTSRSIRGTHRAHPWYTSRSSVVHMPTPRRSDDLSTAWLRVRITADEAARIRHIASTQGMTVADYVRDVALHPGGSTSRGATPAYLRFDPAQNPFPPRLLP